MLTTIILGLLSLAGIIALWLLIKHKGIRFMGRYIIKPYESEPRYHRS